MKPVHTACTSKAAPRGHAEPRLHLGGGGGKGVVGRRGRQHDEIDVAPASRPAAASARSRGAQRQIGGELARRRDMALADAGALHDPLVGGVERARPVRRW